MFNYHPCFFYLIPWIVAFLLIMIFVSMKRAIPPQECRWLHKLLKLLGAVFLILGAFSLPIPAMIGLNVSLFGAGSLMINFTAIAEMADNQLGNQSNKS